MRWTHHTGDAGRFGLAVFDPATLALAAAGASVAAGGISAIGRLQAGKAEAAASTFNAEIAGRQATTELQAGALASGRVYDERRRDIARARASAAASGVDATSGSPLDVLADLAGQAKLEEETVFWNGWQRARAAGSAMTIEQFRAAQAGPAARGAVVGSLLSAGASAAGILRRGL